MPASKNFCADQIMRLSSLRDANFRLQSNYRALWESLHRYADDNDEAERAISLLLDDPDRAADPKRNGVPEPAELALWVTAARGDVCGSPAPEPKQGLCGYCENGLVRRQFERRGLTYEGVGVCVCQGGKHEPIRKQMELV